MYFDELALSDGILDALWDMHFDICTPVQEKTIPVILEGHDVISCAQTGTGKTAAYLLPLLTNLEFDNHNPDKLNAIIMAPTRELAQQIDQQMQGFGFYVPFSSVAVYGGNDGSAWGTQLRGLKSGADVVIATPGRLLSHMNIYDIDFSGVKYFILDEADRMLDMGFYDDIMTIYKHLPADCQKIMFSATMPADIRRMAKAIMHEPVEVQIAVSRPPETIKQMAADVYEPQKMQMVKYLLGGGWYNSLNESSSLEAADNTEERTSSIGEPVLMPSPSSSIEPLKKVIVFVGKKQRVKELAVLLRRKGLDARAMHSDLEQKERDAVMLDFRNGKVDVLVATDIVSRGIDVDDIPLVINYDVPRDAEDYVHRIGRTARAENKGVAVTLVSPDDQRFFSKIERFLHKEIERIPVPSELGEVPAPYQNPVHKTQSPSHGKKHPSKKPHSSSSADSHSSTHHHKHKAKKTSHTSMPSSEQ
ncbi:MAG: DEAD/DEAH box helicase [Paludibacteraceae bacterium]|nr:DEAD/DEAH box helicase [Paludibacteraceae bacterium]